MKKACTIRLNEELLEKMRKIVYLSYGMSLTDFCEIALEREVERWEKLLQQKEKGKMFKKDEFTLDELLPIKLKPGKKLSYNPNKSIEINEE